MWFTSDKTKSHFAQLYDKNGDSFFEDCTEESLKQVFQKISEEVSISTKLLDLLLKFLQLVNNFHHQTFNTSELPLCSEIYMH